MFYGLYKKLLQILIILRTYTFSAKMTTSTKVEKNLESPSLAELVRIFNDTEHRLQRYKPCMEVSQ